MEYFSGYYWQQGDKLTSLVLKQLVYHKGSVPVLFGCMQSCGEPGAVELLTDWFYKEGVYLCGQTGVEPERLEDSLGSVIEEISGKAQEGRRGKIQEKEEAFSFTVLLCAGDSFLLWNQGRQRIHLLNTRFGRPCARRISKDGEECMLSGKLQRGVGILATTDAFWQNISERQIAECLAVKELHTEERVQKRMNELGRKVCQLGGQHVGAMLAVTC